MKILHVINSLGSGGAERLLSDYFFYKSNNTLKHSLYLLSSKSNVFLENIKDTGIDVKISKRKSIYSFLHIWDLVLYIKINKPHIIHVHLFPSLYFIALVSYFHRDSKLIFTEHNTANRRMGNPLFKIADTLVYKRYDLIIAVSDAVKSNLKKWIPGIREIQVVHNGINFDSFRNANKINLRETLSLIDDSILLVMVARFSPQKDHSTVIESMKLLPENYILLLVGEGPEKSKIQLKVKEVNIESRVIFLGFRNDIGTIYKSSDVALLYSHYEGFGLSALEALATEIPLVISDSPGLKEIVGNYALIASSSNPVDLANKILQASNKSKLSQYDENFIDQFSIQEFSKNLSNIYKACLNEIND